MIKIENPYKEIIGIVGMRQTGKTNLLAFILDSLTQRYVCLDTLHVLAKAGFKPKYPVKQRVIPVELMFRQETLKSVVQKVWGVGNYILAIDEVNLYQTKWSIPVELEYLVSLGGNRNISLIWTSRRVQEVHNNIVANTTHHFIFKTFLPPDVDYYSQFIPKNVVLASKDLPPHHFIYYRVGSQPKIFKPTPKYL